MVLSITSPTYETTERLWMTTRKYSPGSARTAQQTLGKMPFLGRIQSMMNVNVMKIGYVFKTQKSETSVDSFALLNENHLLVQISIQQDRHNTKVQSISHLPKVMKDFIIKNKFNEVTYLFINPNCILTPSELNVHFFDYAPQLQMEDNSFVNWSFGIPCDMAIFKADLIHLKKMLSEN